MVIQTLWFVTKKEWFRYIDYTVNWKGMILVYAYVCILTYLNLT